MATQNCAISVSNDWHAFVPGFQGHERERFICRKLEERFRSGEHLREFAGRHEAKIGKTRLFRNRHIAATSERKSESLRAFDSIALRPLQQQWEILLSAITAGV